MLIRIKSRKYPTSYAYCTSIARAVYVNYVDVSNLLSFTGQNHTLFTVTVKSVLHDHIKQEVYLAFQTGGCLLLYESSAGAFCTTFFQK